MINISYRYPRSCIYSQLSSYNTDIVNSIVSYRTHSEYSITQGMVRIPELCDRAVEYGMSSLALSDMDNLFGAVKFYSAARKRGLKPIIGCDVAVYTPEAKFPVAYYS